MRQSSGICRPIVTVAALDRKAQTQVFEIAAIANGDNPGVKVRGDKVFGHLYGELRAGREKRLDPETGAFICNLDGLGIRGQPLRKL